MTMAATCVRDALAQARTLGVARLDAMAVLAHRLQKPRAWLVAHDDAALSADDAQAVLNDLLARASGTPLAYVLGHKEFHGLTLHVSPAVLVPRPDTEVLVDWALEHLQSLPSSQAQPSTPNRQSEAPRAACVVDLGTGSGAVALAIKHRHPAACVHATDASAAALHVARRNAQALQLDVTLHQADWWDGTWLANFLSPIDLVVSNPPYIAAGDAHLPALAHEPTTALVSGADGLMDLRRIIQGAATRLRPGAVLLLEHGHDQAEAVQALLKASGFVGVSTRRDLAGHARCTGGTLA